MNKNLKKLKSELSNFSPSKDKKGDARFLNDIRAELIDLYGDVPYDVNESNMEIEQMTEDCYNLISLIENKRG